MRLKGRTPAAPEAFFGLQLVAVSKIRYIPIQFVGGGGGVASHSSLRPYKVSFLRESNFPILIPKDYARHIFKHFYNFI
jgi:hypothetical protein